jgi:tetratricopeptide (TPR) repeat protein
MAGMCGNGRGFPFLNRWVLGTLLLAAIPGLGQSTKNDEVERYSEAGQKALAAGNYIEAQQSFEKLRELAPSVAEVHANLGLIYFHQGKFELAVPALRQALKLKPSLTRTESLLAMSLSELGHYKEALPGLEKGFQHPIDPEIRRMCGLQLERAYTGLQLDRKAIEVATEMDRLYPRDPEVLYHNGKLFGNFAYLTMRRLVEVAPSSSWRHLAAAEAQESQGAYAEAIGEYRQVLATDPQKPGIHYRLGRTLLARSQQTKSTEDIDAAMREFEQELQIDPTNANAAYEIAEMHRKAGRFDQAEKYFRVALEQYPDFEEAHVGLAGALIGLRDNQQALSELQAAIALNAGDEVAWYRLAQVQRTLGNVSEQQKALAEYQRLHQKTVAENGIEPIASPRDLTKQEVEKDPSQP